MRSKPQTRTSTDQEEKEENKMHSPKTTKQMFIVLHIYNRILQATTH